jgi:protein SCO1/2
VKAGSIAVHLVSFSVDPAHDTPPVLAAYAKEHGADPSRWTFLTGDGEAIRKAVVDGLKVAAQPVGEDQDLASVFHGSHFVLVDAEGRIRGYYDSADADATDRLLADLSRL